VKAGENEKWKLYNGTYYAERIYGVFKVYASRVVE
jgi:hypothetical protein